MEKEMEKADVEMENEEFVDVEVRENTTDGNIESARGSSTQTTEDPLDLIEDTPDIDFDSIGEFCFESDELALKGNTDYKNLLEAMVVLEAQKAKAVRDLEKLKSLQDEALSDPFEFLERLKRKEDMEFPLPQKIYPIPVIDWSKYALCGNPSAFCQRQMSLISTKPVQNISSSKLNGSSYDSKSSGHWTADEEEQLRNLLLEFPSGNTDRWEKISTRLHARHSPNEVAAKARMFALNKGDEKDIAEMNPDLRDSPEFKELLLLKKVLREKLDSTSLSRHTGYKCYSCKTEPIVGVRWHCIDCKTPSSVDFCHECHGCLYETVHHSANHRLERIHASKAFLDCDYMQFVGSDYNYLDPNYMPAT